MVDTIALTVISIIGICFSFAYLFEGLKTYPPFWQWQEKTLVGVMAPLQLAGAKRMCRMVSSLERDARFPSLPTEPVERRLIALTRRALKTEAQGRHLTAYFLFQRAFAIATKHGTKTLIARQAGRMGLFLGRNRAIAANRTKIETAATLTAASFIYGQTALDLYAVYDAAPRRVAEFDWRIRLAHLCDDLPLAYQLHNNALAIERRRATKGSVKRRLRQMGDCAKKLGDHDLAEQHRNASVPYTPTFYTIKRQAEELEYSADEAYRHGQFSRSLRLMHDAEPLILEYLSIAEDEDSDSASQFRDAYEAFKVKLTRYGPRTKPATPLRDNTYLAAAE